MNRRSAGRELRRANARRNWLANEIAGLLAAGRTPDHRLVAEWEAASARLFALQKSIRPRECGSPLGEGLKQ